MTALRTTVGLPSRSRFEPKRPGRSRGLSARRLLERLLDDLAGASDPLEATVLTAAVGDAARVARAITGERGWTGR
jgi:hypothetical protein